MRGAGEVAETIDGNTGRFVESGDQKRRRQMREVMLDLMELAPSSSTVRLLQAFP